MTSQKTLRFSAILLLAVQCAACASVPGLNASRLDNDFYYVPPQAVSPSVYTAGQALD